MTSSLSSLKERLAEELEAVLREASLHSISSYGWLTENEPDPDFIGHAMWQSDGPSIPDDWLFNGKPLTVRPKENENDTIWIGADFEGMMEMSRLSIGLSLIWKGEALVDLINTPQFFWLHHADALLKLSMASERLRDLLIVASTGRPRTCYPSRIDRNSKYVRPFHEASKMLRDRGKWIYRLSDPLSDLPEKADKIYVLIKKRSTLAHEIATDIANFLKACGREMVEEYSDPQERSAVCGEGDWFPRASRGEASHRESVEAAVKDMKDWYLLLVDASNLVFQIEYWTRAPE